MSEWLNEWGIDISLSKELNANFVCITKINNGWDDWMVDIEGLKDWLLLVLLQIIIEKLRPQIFEVYIYLSPTPHPNLYLILISCPTAPFIS